MIRVESISWNEPCDKCQKPIVTEAAGIQFYESARGQDRNVINLHYSCLEKLVKKAKRDAEPVAEAAVTA